jgi:hypothetical protein
LSLRKKIFLGIRKAELSKPSAKIFQALSMYFLIVFKELIAVFLVPA